MGTDRNLLFGVLAFQMELISAQQFAESCAQWITRKDVPLSDILIEVNWISPVDKTEIDRLVERSIRKQDCDVTIDSDVSADNPIDCTQTQGVDDDVENPLAHLSGDPPSRFVTTAKLAPELNERYEISDLYARGGFGRVWLARDNQLGRNVALKDIRPQRADDATGMARFLKEAQITGQLEHPGVVPVYELRRRPVDQQPFYTMRFIKGRTLREAIREYHQRKQEDPTRALDLVGLLSAFVAVCNTIAYAHSRGVIHRDLKGENIILGDYGEVHVLDWGLAKLMAEPDGNQVEQPLELDSDTQLSVDGQTLGTPAYMAPEQARGNLGSIDHRTDVYGLGAILYELLTGRTPFSGSNLGELFESIISDEPISPAQISSDVPANLEAICLRALAKEASDRFQSASDLADGVRQWQEQQRQQAIQALKESQALYSGLVETLPLVIWRKDAIGLFQFVNHGFSELFGARIDDVMRKSDFELGWGDSGDS